MKRRHINIPIFIPHLGCPHDCLFCNQRSISGRIAFDARRVVEDIERALTTADGAEAEIAFFGGSFTGIERETMLLLLDTAEQYVREGRVTGIRLSTRPDYIDDEMLAILSRYMVRQVELGIQSMDDTVLAACRRGHTAADTARACERLRSWGMPFVGQMMIGLPMATGESERITAERICAMGAVAARIYPLVVLKQTPLAAMTAQGRYCPLEAEEMIVRSADALSVFRRHGVNVLRIGLQAGEELTSGEEIACGFYHPAMGELVEGELYYRTMAERMVSLPLGAAVTVTVPRGELSKAIGQKGRNRERLKARYALSSLRFLEGGEDVKELSLAIGEEGCDDSCRNM